MLSRVFLSVLLMAAAGAAGAQEFKAGVAVRDITPQQPVPMWGYGARHDYLSTGANMPLRAKVLVLDGGNDKVALVGLDIGRGPTYAMMERIEQRVREEAGVGCVLAVGCHTHHGPVIELLDQPGLGQGKFDASVAYAKQLPETLADAIVEAAKNAVPAAIGVAVEETDLNRNRHSKKEPKVRDPRLSVLRVDDLNGKTLAVMANLAAHPVLESIMDRKFSADWVGHMQQGVEAELGTMCMFMQGASGDMSPNTNAERKGPEGFGKAVAAKVAEMARAIQPAVPAAPGVTHLHRSFSGPSRLDFKNPIVVGTLSQAFFPELMAMLVEVPDNTVTAKLTTVVVNGDLAFAGVSGELFSDLSNQIKAQSPVANTLVFGYCNGHCMYIPTESAVGEGGYGADPTVAWVPVGTGEKIAAQAAADLKELGAK